MKKSQFLKAGTASVALSLALVSMPAFAQDATQDAAATAADATATTDDPIIVTGTLIKNPNLERSAPVNVTTADDLELLQTNVAEEVLREIPGVVPSIGSAVNNGNGGSSYVNLRGLGENRNLVLLDGQRIVPASLGGVVDLNNIPLALVERMDVLTGGSSTTYGADAVTGVVNFITKRDFAGVEATAGYQITDKGDGAVFRADLTIGANFDDGRGNVVLGLGYQDAEHVTQGDRAISINNIDSFSGGSGGSGTTFPSRATIDGVAYQASPDFQSLVRYYQPYNFNPSNIFQTPFKRYNMYAAGRYEASDAIEFYARGMFSKNTVDTEIAPSGAFGIGVNVPSTNPYLTDQMRAILCGSATTPCSKTVALFRRAVEAGPRVSSYGTTIFDYMAGVRGKVTDTINFDVSASYGQSENIQTIKGYTSNARWRSGVNCAVGDTSCTIVNPFGILTPEMVDYLVVESNSFVKTTLAQARGMFSGDFGFQLPSASNPIAFAVGAEYRKYTAAQGADTLASSGDLGGAGGATPDVKGAYDVYEFIGEVVVPLIQDKSFFEDLTLEAGIRNSHYSVEAPGNPKYSATTWKVGGSWTPGAGFKVRGNYAHAVRAPNIEELFSPRNVGLTNLSYDPCATIDDNGDPIPGRVITGTLRDVCLAQGATPAHLAAGIAVPTAGQANATFSGSTNMKPEKSNSWTVGFVWQPDFVRGFNMSVDYYNIKVKNAITFPTPDDTMTSCFGANMSPTNPLCTVIRRDPLTGQLSGDSNTTPGLPAPTTNSGYLSTDGVDFSLNYKHDLDFAKLGLGVQANWTRSSKFRSIPTGILRECVGYYSVNCASPQPEWSWTTRATLGFDGIDVSLLWRHISGMKYEPLEFDPALDGFPLSGSGPVYSGSDVFGEEGKNFNFNKIKAYDWFDLTTRFDVSDNLGITLTVQNLFDKKPPLVGNSLGSTTYNSGNTYPSTYDAIGRRYGVQAKLKF